MVVDQMLDHLTRVQRERRRVEMRAEEEQRIAEQDRHRMIIMATANNVLSDYPPRVCECNDCMMGRPCAVSMSSGSLSAMIRTASGQLLARGDTLRPGGRGYTVDYGEPSSRPERIANTGSIWTARYQNEGEASF